MLTSEEAAYAAGIFDGEGCVLFRKNGYGISLSMSQKNPEVLEWFQKIFGAGTITHRPNNGSYIYRWTVGSRGLVLTIIEAIFPYSIVKKEKLLRAKELLDAKAA